MLWRIYSKRAVLTAGATERPIAFAMNDRPGIMLAGAVRAYANRFGVDPGQACRGLTNNDDGWRTAADLAAKGVEIAAVIDTANDAQPRSSGRVVMGGARGGYRWAARAKPITLADGQTIPTGLPRRLGRLEPERAPDLPPARAAHGWRDDIALCPLGDLPAGMSSPGPRTAA